MVACRGFLLLLLCDGTISWTPMPAASSPHVVAPSVADSVAGSDAPPAGTEICGSEPSAYAASSASCDEISSLIRADLNSLLCDDLNSLMDDELELHRN